MSKNDVAKHKHGKCLAVRTCEQRGWSFKEVFRYQYRIGKTAIPLGEGWSTRVLGDWVLQHCKALETCALIDGAGVEVGFILGIAIAPDGRCLKEKHVIAEPEFDRLERWVEQLSGRYIALVWSADQTRLYSDPAGNLSAVFDAEKKVVASSVTLIVEDELRPHPHVSLERIVQRQQVLILGDTSDERVMRARPNHYLDLMNFSQHRHWPREDVEFVSLNANRRAIYAEAAEKLGRNIAALSDGYRCALPITAGMDSRTLLAAATPVLEKIEHFYCYAMNWATEIDAALAARLAQHLAIPFQVLSRKSPRIMTGVPEGYEAEEYEKMYLRIGHCHSIRRDWPRFVAQAPRVDVVMCGPGVELARAKNWRNLSLQIPCNSVLGLQLLSGMKEDDVRDKSTEERYQRLLGLYEDWMNSFPENALPRLYDMGHMELWMPSPINASFSSFGKDFIVNPFNDRRLFHLASGIAPRARRRGMMVHAIISAFDPSLMNFRTHRGYSKALAAAARGSNSAGDPAIMDT